MARLVTRSWVCSDGANGRSSSRRTPVISRAGPRDVVIWLVLANSFVKTFRSKSSSILPDIRICLPGSSPHRDGRFLRCLVRRRAKRWWKSRVDQGSSYRRAPGRCRRFLQNATVASCHTIFRSPVSGETLGLEARRGVRATFAARPPGSGGRPALPSSGLACQLGQHDN
jgi:hypothetical protein